ncbi:MAG TPA: hypothetical protein DD490_12600 [Acidobacteria bacterium]|nr:hypothetical protein [Acidobacteriota bacterium]
MPTALLLFPRGGSGSYEGLVATGEAVRLDVGQIPPDNFFETYLSFGLESRARTLLLNPARPELAQVVLYRVSSGSNLVSAESWFNITLRLDPTLGGGDRLIINNLVEPAVGASYNGFLASSTKPGRGLVADGLLTSCHDKLTDFDRHVFSILQRTVRGNETTQFFEPDMEVAIFRGREPNVYRLNFYPIYEGLEESGRMAVELRLSWDDHGRLLAAQSVVLAACSGPGEIGCTSWDRGSLFWWLFHPLFGGREYYDSERIQFGGWFRSGEGPSTPRTLDLATLLTGSTWNEPVW